VIDDEDAVQRLVRFPLEREGYRVLGASSGEDGLRLVEAERPDLVLLDLMLPGMDGIEVCRRLRVLSATLPIIMLTARDDEVDKVLGLELGADDYITKPFSIREFRSRIRAVLRRAGLRADRITDGMIEAGVIAIDPAKRAVTVDGERAQLTYVEFEVLHTLASHPGRVYSRQALLEAVWGDSAYREPRTIDVHIRHLREKIEADPREPAYIFTVRGVGYRFRDTMT
jgi:DNA-binding response OmpR family regulator